MDRNKTNTTVEFAKRHKVALSILAIALILLISIVLRLLTPRTEAPTKGISRPVLTPVFMRSRAQTLPITVSIQDGVAPNRSSASVFESQNYQPTAFVTSVTKSFNLAPARRISNVFYNEDYSVSITLTSTPGLMHFFDTNLAPDQNTTITESTAQEMAISFMAKIGYPVNELTLVSAKYINPEAEGAIELSTSSRSSIELVYKRLLEGSDISLGNSSDQVVFLNAGNKGIYKAYLPALTFEVTDLGDTDLLPLAEVLPQISEGRFILLSDPVALQSGAQIQNFIITKAEVEYRFDEDQKLFIPFYQLTGNATFTNQDRATILISTPAVKLL